LNCKAKTKVLKRLKAWEAAILRQMQCLKMLIIVFPNKKTMQIKIKRIQKVKLNLKVLEKRTWLVLVLRIGISKASFQSKTIK
jgi:hypothetical protein